MIKDASTCKENQKLTHNASDGLPGKNASFPRFPSPKSEQEKSGSAISGPLYTHPFNSHSSTGRSDYVHVTGGELRCADGMHKVRQVLLETGF